MSFNHLSSTPSAVVAPVPQAPDALYEVLWTQTIEGKESTIQHKKGLLFTLAAGVALFVAGEDLSAQNLRADLQVTPTTYELNLHGDNNEPIPFTTVNAIWVSEDGGSTHTDYAVTRYYNTQGGIAWGTVSIPRQPNKTLWLSTDTWLGDDFSAVLKTDANNTITFWRWWDDVETTWAPELWLPPEIRNENQFSPSMSTDAQQLTIPVTRVDGIANGFDGAVEADATATLYFTDGSSYDIGTFESVVSGTGTQIVDNNDEIKGKTVSHFVVGEIKKTAPAGLTFNTVLGVEDEIVESTKIYPIPVKQGELLKIESPFSIADRWEDFEIYDIQGKQVYKQELFDNGYDAEAYGIDTSNLKPGVYILRATSQKGWVKSTKIIVE